MFHVIFPVVRRTIRPNHFVSTDSLTSRLRNTRDTGLCFRLPLYIFVRRIECAPNPRETMDPVFTNPRSSLVRLFAAYLVQNDQNEKQNAFAVWNLLRIWNRLGAELVRFATFARITRMAGSFHSTRTARRGNVLSIVEKLLNTEWTVRVDGMAFVVNCKWC